jgi:hypothetical protein
MIISIFSLIFDTATFKSASTFNLERYLFLLVLKMLFRINKSMQKELIDMACFDNSGYSDFMEIQNVSHAFS